jgi:hypothetical protein
MIILRISLDLFLLLSLTDWSLHHYRNGPDVQDISFIIYFALLSHYQVGKKGLKLNQRLQ